MATSFVYPPLTGRYQTRVLRLDPGQRESSVSGTLLVVSLDKAGKGCSIWYQALSYMWGTSNDKALVSLDGANASVSLHLEGILRDLRHASKARYLWIDALCINQDDIVERNLQVQLMRRIYRQADAVLIWLDRSIDTGHPSFQTLHGVCADSQLPTLGTSPGFWDPVCEILKDEYWSRVWIQQEISNAVTLRLLCRNVELDVCSIYHIIRLFKEIQTENIMGQTWWDWALKNPSVTLPERFGRADSYLQPFRGTTLGEVDMDLLTVLSRTNTLRCTDDRDRVYGIMFLAANCQDGDIDVDYSRPISCVYTSAAVSIMNKYDSNRILAYATFDYGQLSVKDPTPTWVPDWRRPPPRLSMARVLPPLIPRNRRLPLTVVDKVLSVTAVHVGTLKYFYRESFARDLLSQSVAEFVENCVTMTRDAICINYSTEGSGQSTASIAEVEGTTEWQALVRTMGGLDNRDRSKHPDLPQILYKGAKEVHSLYRLHGDYDPSTVQLGQLLNTRMSAEDNMLKAGKVFVSFAWWLLVKHAPFLTIDGRPGLAPKCAAPGDEIWLIQGCEVPIMLRPEGAKHKVVGEAYLDGANFWEPVGGPQDEVEEGDVVNGHIVQLISLI